ncbi:unnamed protein product, partial [Amoebophrya sp. A25]
LRRGVLLCFLSLGSAAWRRLAAYGLRSRPPRVLSSTWGKSAHRALMVMVCARLGSR